VVRGLHPLIERAREARVAARAEEVVEAADAALVVPVGAGADRADRVPRLAAVEAELHIGAGVWRQLVRVVELEHRRRQQRHVEERRLVHEPRDGAECAGGGRHRRVAAGETRRRRADHDAARVVVDVVPAALGAIVKRGAVRIVARVLNKIEAERALLAPVVGRVVGLARAHRVLVEADAERRAVPLRRRADAEQPLLAAVAQIEVVIVRARRRPRDREWRRIEHGAIVGRRDDGAARNRRLADDKVVDHGAATVATGAIGTKVEAKADVLLSLRALDGAADETPLLGAAAERRLDARANQHTAVVPRAASSATTLPSEAIVGGELEPQTVAVVERVDGEPERDKRRANKRREIERSLNAKHRVFVRRVPD
jgi:hypothetical protein